MKIYCDTYENETDGCDYVEEVKMGHADALRLCTKKENGTDGCDYVKILKMGRTDAIL